MTALSAGHFDSVKLPLRANGLFSSLLTAAYPIGGGPCPLKLPRGPLVSPRQAFFDSLQKTRPMVGLVFLSYSIQLLISPRSQAAHSAIPSPVRAEMGMIFILGLSLRTYFSQFSRLKSK